MTTGRRRDLGPFEAVRGLSYDAPLPELFPVRQRFLAQGLSDVPSATRAALEPLRARIVPGMTVAITAGSRGISDGPAVLRAAGDWLRAAGAVPFVVPAMGSHGGATAQAQVDLLADLGMTEASLGMPIRATMDTVELGRVDRGPRVHLDRIAAAADAILVVNRVKAHTDFAAEVESGLAKMTAIGLGKQRGAEGIHAHGPAELGRWVPEVARRIVGTGQLLGGLAIVEDPHHRAAAVELVEPAGIGGAHEARLLARAKALAPGLPFARLDVLVVDAMGKDRSGTGMDTNVIGRRRISGSPEPDEPAIATLAVLDVTDASHGNCAGIGLADFVPFRVLEKIDLHAMYVNAMTSGLGGPQRAQLPIALPTDRDAVAAAVLTCGRADLEGCRLVRVRDTLDLEHLLVSTSLREQVDADPTLEVLGEPAPMTFEESGALCPWGA